MPPLVLPTVAAAHLVAERAHDVVGTDNRADIVPLRVDRHRPRFLE